MRNGPGYADRAVAFDMLIAVVVSLAALIAGWRSLPLRARVRHGYPMCFNGCTRPQNPNDCLGNGAEVHFDRLARGRDFFAAHHHCPFIVPRKRATEQVQSPDAKNTRYGRLSSFWAGKVFQKAIDFAAWSSIPTVGWRAGVSGGGGRRRRTGRGNEIFLIRIYCTTNDIRRVNFDAAHTQPRRDNDYAAEA